MRLRNRVYPHPVPKKESKMAYQPKKYFSKGRTVEWGKDLTPEQMKALKKGEIFILLKKDGKPHSEILMDSYNQIRERAIKEKDETHHSRF